MKFPSNVPRLVMDMSVNIPNIPRERPRSVAAANFLEIIYEMCSTDNPRFVPRVRGISIDIHDPP